MNAKEFVLNPVICSLPWIGVYVQPDGTVKNCAISNEILGNIHNNTLEECLHGQKNQQVKQDMIDNIQHSRCDSCYKVEDLSNNKIKNESNRSWYKKYGIKNIDLNIYNKPTNFELRVLDLRWRNTCNQACVYCSPDLSSRWAQEMNDHRYIINDSVLDQTKQYIFQRLDNVDHRYLAGGEPLLIKENKELLEKLLTVNPDVEIRVNSNLSVVDTDVFRLLMKFKNVKWTISVDAIQESYEYIRWPGKWDRFKDNLMLLNSQNNNINFNMVWCALNATGIFDCVDFLNSIGFQENMYIIQCLDHPTPLDVRSLPKDQIATLKKLMHSRLETANPSHWFAKCLTSMLNFLELDNKSTTADLKEFLQTLDRRRNLDSKKIFPHVYQ